MLPQHRRRMRVNKLLDASKYIEVLQGKEFTRLNGKVSQVIGLMVESIGPEAKVGDVCEIYPNQQKEPILAEVVGFRDNKVLLMPLGELQSVGQGCDVVNTGKPLTVKTGPE